jgi:3-deoxy-D-arabino-heptulosonate 7-phosphate (DAHP) synthase class II
VALVRWGTTDAQQTMVGRPDEVAELAAAVRLAPPVVIVVGDVVNLRQRLAWLAEERPRLRAVAGGGQPRAALFHLR